MFLAFKRMESCLSKQSIHSNRSYFTMWILVNTLIKMAAATSVSHLQDYTTPGRRGCGYTSLMDGAGQDLSQIAGEFTGLPMTLKDVLKEMSIYKPKDGKKTAHTIWWTVRRSYVAIPDGDSPNKKIELPPQEKWGRIFKTCFGKEIKKSTLKYVTIYTVGETLYIGWKDTPEKITYTDRLVSANQFRKYKLEDFLNNMLVAYDDENCTLVFKETISYLGQSYDVYREWDFYAPLKERHHKTTCMLVRNPYNEFKQTLAKLTIYGATPEQSAKVLAPSASKTDNYIRSTNKGQSLQEGEMVKIIGCTFIKGLGKSDDLEIKKGNELIVVNTSGAITDPLQVGDHVVITGTTSSGSGIYWENQRGEKDMLNVGTEDLKRYLKPIVSSVEEKGKKKDYGVMHLHVQDNEGNIFMLPESEVDQRVCTCKESATPTRAAALAKRRRLTRLARETRRFK